MDYVYTSLPLLCLLELCMYVFCHFVFLTLGTHALCTFSVSQSSTCHVLFFYSNIFLQLDPDPVLPRCLLLPFRDRIPQTARIGPVGKLLNVRQGDRKIEDYAMDFEWLASPLWKRPSSCSSSGEAWLSPSDPGCLTGFQRSRWRTTSIWL